MSLAKMRDNENKKGSFSCPYCCIFALFLFGESRTFASIEIREGPCPSCGKLVIQIREIDSTLTLKATGGYERKRELGKWIIVWPKLRLLCTDKAIPVEILDDLNKAHSIIDISPDAAAGLARRALERILKKYLDLRGKNLQELIEASKSVLHPRVFELLDGVRGYGNFGAHLKEDSVSGEPLAVETAEAVFVLDAVKELANEEFIYKARANQMLEQLKAKKEKIKKRE